MRITDYASSRTLNDVSLSLTPNEAAELAAYLERLVNNPTIGKAYLSEVVGNRLERELTVTIQTPAA
ncbi:MAG TPA: hypothetical protein PKA27_12305 [Fimbriimonadaceae bacterium]|nr:hypothetical protein [Fimbriimonadaceae bacterium]